MKNKEKLTWKIEKRKVAKLVPADYNPRKLSDKAKADLMESVVRFGQVEPVVVNVDSTIIGGHQRITVYADLGLEETDVMVPNRKLDKKEERELNIRLNKNIGEWDWRKLKDLFQISELVEAGFGEDELSAFFDKITDVREDDFDVKKEYETIKTPKTKKGDIWMMGEHRLMCGDSTDEKDVKTLMNKELGTLIFTDPPYSVDYKSMGGHSYSKGKYGGNEVFNDKKTSAEAEKFYTDILLNLYNNTTDSCPIFWWFGTKQYKANIGAFENSGWHESQVIIWLKGPKLKLGMDYLRTYEPCMFGWKKRKKHFRNKVAGLATLRDAFNLEYNDFAEMLDVWYVKRDPTMNYEHPTQKPVKLAEYALKKYSSVGGTVIDLFGGSGSTLIGCEQLQRKCFSMEIDPKYCDVIIRRWEKYTSKQAQKHEQ